MVYTVLIEPFTIPKLVPVEITVLRGVRRLRFSHALSRRYSDFAPKLWHYLTVLGYKKFLQRLYIMIDHSAAIESRLYEFPILCGVLAAVQLLPQKQDFFSLGNIDPFGRVQYPAIFEKLLYYKQNIPFASALNQISTAKTTESIPSNESIRTSEIIIAHANEILPNVTLKNDRISVESTALPVLKRIPPEIWQCISAYCNNFERLPEPKKRWLQYEAPHQIAVIQADNKKERGAIPLSSFLETQKRS